ncbi:hypothetical protein [Streptomyces sp. NBC_00557]|jgi:hypothetical protein|uniref:hypothetical protein n=1 Tax=Streptomyces sp. NBC_00557 TaxID=2975776 RepID=UPI002E7FD398|nr:hypothetical protein [Streptomyces sp. NBC_00557]WUC34421.1 hypothetical protein OG956_09470 [Streptomyces sp. NBC_00557]
MSTEQHDEPPPATEGEHARQAEERFIDDLIARGEAVPEGEDIPPGATHVIVHDQSGRRTVRRVRFSGHHQAPREE